MEKEHLPAVAFFGPVGAGKTTLLNMLSGKSFETADKGWSCTRILQNEQCQYKPFLIYDFPGTDAQVEKVQHMVAQSAALRQIEFTVICLVVALTGRLDDLHYRLVKILRLFQYHTANLVVVLTRCDEHSEQNVSEAANVIKEMAKLEHVFCKKKNTEASRLAAWLYSFIDPTPQQRSTGILPFEKVAKGEGCFLSDSFQAMISDNCMDRAVMESRRKIENEFIQIYEAHKTHFQEAKEDEIKMALYLSIKNWMDFKTDEHSQTVAHTFKSEDELTCETMIIMNTLRNIYQPFRELVIRSIQPETIVYNSDTPSYRKCPYCGTIWVRVYGCHSMKCGNRSVSRDLSNRTFYNYVIDWAYGALSIKRKETPRQEFRFNDREVVGLTEEEKKANASEGRIPYETAEALKKANKQVTGPIEIRPIGCGATLNWSTMTDVTNEVVEQIKQFDFAHTANAEGIAKKHFSSITKLDDRRKRPVDPSDWTVDDVTDWLFDIKLSQYSNSFKENKINGKQLKELSREDLKDLDVKALADKKTILAEIKNLFESIVEV
jgi:GTP-binding protein EngB required for normal cell division